MDEDKENFISYEEVECDCICMSGGWTPTVMKDNKNQTINSSSLESIHRFNLNEDHLLKIDSLKAKYGTAKSEELYDAELNSLKNNSTVEFLKI